MTQRTMRAPLLCLLCLLCLFTIVLTGCRSSRSSAEENAVTAVVPDGEGGMRVEAVLTESFLEQYSGKKIYLFELPLSFAADADLGELDPIAECKPRGTVTFEVSAYDGVRSRLYSSFLIASYDPSADCYTALTPPRAVSDLSAMGEAASEERGEVTVKGLISEHPADADLLGVAHTVVDVYIDRLILDGWQEGAVPYIWNGLTAYVDGHALDKLDETVGAYTSADIRVYLRFVLRAPGEDARVPLCLYMPTDGAVSDEAYFAVNMGDAQTVDLLAGFLDFMADRYASPEDGGRPVDAFIMGYRVNHADLYNYGGADMTLEDAVDNYEKLVRVANTALKSHCSDGQVYVSLDCHRAAGDMAGEGWDVPSFLSAFNRRCDLLGNFDWQVACELYADTVDIWLEDTEKDGQYYTVHSLGTLTDLLVSDKFRTPDGGERGVLISGFAIPAVGDGLSAEEVCDMQAASYAYAYMVCVENRHVEGLIYSTYADGADGSGLWAVTREGDADMISEKKPIYHVFKQIDTTESAGLAESLTAVMGEAYTKLAQALLGRAPAVTAVTGEAVLKEFEANHPKADPVFRFDRGSLEGFEGMGSLTCMELISAETIGTVNLHARFDTLTLCDPMGIRATLPASEIMGGKKLILDLYAGEMGHYEARPSVTLRLTRPATGLVGDGDGELLYEAAVTGVRDGVWQTAEFDVSEFVNLLDSDDQVTVTVLVDYGGDGVLHPGTRLGLAGVYLSGNAVTANHSAGVVIGVVIALSVLVAGVFLALFLRSKRQ